jgi:NAD(P)H-dependent FMN reductase
MKIIILPGSNRKDATSTALCKYIQQLLEEKGCEVSLFDLYETPVPFYGKGIVYDDANLRRMKQLFLDAQAVVLATPEYHGTMSGVLKNALDHLGSDHFSSKPVLSVSSAGGAVGVSSLQNLQTVVRYVHGINCPEWISIGGDNRRFTPEGEPADAKTKERVHRTVDYFFQMTKSLQTLK